jgi:hypothetical protein
VNSKSRRILRYKNQCRKQAKDRLVSIAERHQHCRGSIEAMRALAEIGEPPVGPLDKWLTQLLAGIHIGRLLKDIFEVDAYAPPPKSLLAYHRYSHITDTYEAIPSRTECDETTDADPSSEDPCKRCK